MGRARESNRKGVAWTVVHPQSSKVIRIIAGLRVVIPWKATVVQKNPSDWGRHGGISDTLFPDMGANGRFVNIHKIECTYTCHFCKCFACLIYMPYSMYPPKLLILLLLSSNKQKSSRDLHLMCAAANSLAALEGEAAA